jgi:ankyrin repeat protein
MRAVANDDLVSTERLLSVGANPNALEAETHNQDTVLTKAVVHARPELIRRLLKAGSDPNSRQGANRWGKTALIIAVEADSADVVALLLDAGAAVESRVGGISGERNIQGGTTDALAAAVESSHSESVRLLLLAGARIDRIHLELAVRTGRPELLRLLLRAGGDPRAVLRNGQSLIQAVNAAADPARTEMMNDVRRFLHPQ